jgi:hypothetical protein
VSGRKLVEHLEHFQHRIMQDALAEATSAYWLKRAADFDAVGTPEADETAQACRNRARVALDGDVEEFYELLEDVLAEGGARP